MPAHLVEREALPEKLGVDAETTKARLARARLFKARAPLGIRRLPAMSAET